ncbi:MAG: acyl carrier protein [Bacteroidetes bacterium]|nr:MAG: acyl carrier protein [Bacteroidota bacterium]
MKPEIISKTNSIFQKVFEDKNLQINENMSAKDVAKWDSLNHLSMISEVESEFGIKFKLKELVAMQNVGDLLKAIESKL